MIYVYHKIENSDYLFSRIKEEFENDIQKMKEDLIAFDDGHLCQYEIAYPLLVKYGLKSIFFIATGLIGERGYMDWDQVKELSKHFQIGVHSHSHRNLSELTEEEVRDEISKSKKILEEKIGPMKYFVTPYEKTNDTVDRVAQELGLEHMKGRKTILKNTIL